MIRIVKPFSSRKVSAEKAIKLLNRRGIRINEDEAIVILDFLYLLASCYAKRGETDEKEKLLVREISNTESLHIE